MDGYTFKESLKFYYDFLFPYEEFYQWLSYGNNETFSKREFSYATNDAYHRWNSYFELQSFKDYLKKYCPERIDIGAVYSVAPNQRDMVLKSAMVPVEKELVFDIDMNDYNEVRTCCQGANICGKCWKLMVGCIQVLNDMLREDFGFKNLLFVFSGRRGVHCWVADANARKLAESSRCKVVEWFRVISGGDNQTKKVSLLRELHPSLERVYQKYLLPLFENHILEDQQVLDKHEKQILDLIPNPNLVASIVEDWEQNKDESRRERWSNLVASVDQDMKDHPSFYSSNPIYDIVFTFTYPRLDVHVSTGLNHLLKAPFCIHPSTHRVCVPIDLEHLDVFDPLQVPTVESLVKDIDDWANLNKENSADNSQKSLKSYKKTKLAPYIKFFKEGFLQPLQKDLRTQPTQIHEF
jgi:DNA primase small subunit